MDSRRAMLSTVVPFPPLPQLRAELLAAGRLLHDRQMLYSAQWVLELANGVPHTHGLAPAAASIDARPDMLEIEAEGDAGAAYALATSYFGTKEFRRCAHTVQRMRSPRATFLHAYSLFLAGEETRERDAAERGSASSQNKELLELDSLLQKSRQRFGRLLSASGEGLLLWLHGVVLRELEQNAAAADLLCQSVAKYPMNWAAWVDLATLLANDELLPIRLPDHWMRNAFSVHFLLEAQDNDNALTVLRACNEAFPRSTYFLAQHALIHYNLREFDQSSAMFETVLQDDPHRIENLESFSNILYVKEDRTRLSQLAHATQASHPYRAETCCIIGNLYSLKGEHTKAVTYFQRALRLNKRLLSAWTLMGHEYLELKDTAAAVHAYRKAVEVSPKEYRAWYGLGQTYELLHMSQYAMHYYRKATALRPYDSRMWCALANCYEGLGRLQEAVKCYERADKHGDRERLALSRLPALYEQLQQPDVAAEWHLKNLEQRDAEEEAGQPTIDALCYLAHYYMRKGLLKEAEKYATRLLDFSGKEKEDAKSILRDLHAASTAMSP